MEKKNKTTGTFGRFCGWLISILLIAALAGGFVMQYPTMVREAKKVYQNGEQDNKTDALIDYINNNYALIDGMYVDWYKSRTTDEKTAGEIILGDRLTKYACEDRYTTWYEVRKETLDTWYAFDYPMLLENSGIFYLVYKDSIADGCGTLDTEVAFNDATAYPFFLEVCFDAKGLPVVKQARGVEGAQEVVTESYRNRSSANVLMMDYSVNEFAEHTGLPQITVLLACDVGTYEAVQDVGMSWSRSEALSALLPDYTLLLLTAIGIAVFLGLLLPAIRPLGLKEGWKANIWLEILFTVACLAAVVMAEEMPRFILECQIELDHPGNWFVWGGIMQDLVADGREVHVISSIHNAIWFVLFFLVYLCALNIRQLFAKGAARYFAENTFTGRCVVWVYRQCKKLVRFCQTLDFSEKGTKKFLIAVALNYLVIAILCCTWFVGILIAVPYSLLLFWLLQKKWKQIRTDYTVLLSTTEEMAHGVTDVEYMADAGVFCELQTALSGVQEGFHTAVQEEVKSQRMKTELITNVSHDLKTPLTAIITYVDLLKNDALTNEERTEYVAVLERKSMRLKALIEDLFDISKASSGDIRLDKVELDLVKLILEVQLELEEEIMKSGITFKVNLPEEKVMVCLDAQKTCRIFENLTMNVVKYALGGSRAYLSMEQTEKEVTVIYKNVSAAEITYNAEEILERFTRGDVSRNTEGSGLGLAIVKSFAEAQGGRVKIELEDDLFKVMVTFPKQ